LRGRHGGSRWYLDRAGYGAEGSALAHRRDDDAASASNELDTIAKHGGASGFDVLVRIFLVARVLHRSCSN
jgi:hypothetical protein